MAATYHVQALWDPEAGVWTSASDVPGLVVEAESLAEFEDLVRSLAPELISENLEVHGPTRIKFEFRGKFEFQVAS
ncbi:MAG: DUF1902 domain-containing protein [Proteobacteria bacterium]|nr:DUF1902 domain-containing protein [Pseudomonadota bacterium]